MSLQYCPRFHICSDFFIIEDCDVTISTLEICESLSLLSLLNLVPPTQIVIRIFIVDVSFDELIFGPRTCKTNFVYNHIGRLLFTNMNMLWSWYLLEIAPHISHNGTVTIFAETRISLLFMEIFKLSIIQMSLSRAKVQTPVCNCYCINQDILSGVIRTSNLECSVQNR